MHRGLRCDAVPSGRGRPGRPGPHGRVTDYSANGKIIRCRASGCRPRRSRLIEFPPRLLSTDGGRVGDFLTDPTARSVARSLRSMLRHCFGARLLQDHMGRHRFLPLPGNAEVAHCYGKNVVAKMRNFSYVLALSVLALSVLVLSVPTRAPQRQMHPAGRPPIRATRSAR